MQLVLLLSLTFLTACTSSLQLGRTQSPISPEEAASDLERLSVKAPVSEGYNRKDWRHWIDDDHDCQDARQEVLIAESEIPVSFKTERKCEVLTGQWTCPYTGEVFVNPRKLDVDHMLPLGAAHNAGGHGWDSDRRRDFANDLKVEWHLIAVKASANRSKGKSRPDEWLPANDNYVCEYVRTWIDIKVRWELSVTSKEKAFLESATKLCEQGRVPRLMAKALARCCHPVTELLCEYPSAALPGS